MKEGDTFPFGAGSWHLVDEPNAGSFAASKRTVQVVDGETDMMKAGTTFGDELADG